MFIIMLDGLRGETMQVTIEYFLTFRELTRRESETIEIGEETTVRDVLQLIADKYGEKTRDTLFDRGGSLKEYIRVLVDGRDIRGLNGMSTRLHPNCTVSLFPPAGGGSCINQS